MQPCFLVRGQIRHSLPPGAVCQCTNAATEGQACPAGRHDHVSANWVQQQDGSDAVTAKFIVYGGIGLHGILGDIWMTPG